MFSFKTLHIRPRRFVPAIVVAVACLLLVEIAFRVNNWFYDYRGWESPGLMKKMEDAETLFQEEGRIDLVTLSTSVGRAWDVRQWEEATGGDMVAYNFGYPDQRPERQYFMFKNYIYPKYKPRHVIYGVGPGDCNSNIHGMHPDHPRQGAFWTYRNIRRIASKTLLDKGMVLVDDMSYVFRARRRARFTLQHGPLWMLEEEPTIGHGVLVPTVRRQPYGPMELSWGRLPEGLPNNDYHNYWIPDDGEIGELLKMVNFCKKHDVKMAIVEFPTSPYSHTNFDDPEWDYHRFVNALNYLESKGAWVLPMAREINLDNTMYEDQAHMNRWGAQVATDYTYQHVIREWFPQATAPALNDPVQINFADVITSAPGTTIHRLQPATDEAEYAAELQVQVTEPRDIELTSTLAAGSYAVELYGGDGRTTTPELTGEAAVELAAVNDAGDVVASLPIDRWINSRVGISYTQAWLTLPEPAALVVRVTKLDGAEPLILDSAFIRKRLADTGNGVIVH